MPQEEKTKKGGQKVEKFFRPVFEIPRLGKKGNLISPKETVSPEGTKKEPLRKNIGWKGPLGGLKPQPQGKVFINNAQVPSGKIRTRRGRQSIRQLKKWKKKHGKEKKKRPEESPKSSTGGPPGTSNKKRRKEESSETPVKKNIKRKTDLVFQGAPEPSPIKQFSTKESYRGYKEGGDFTVAHKCLGMENRTFKKRRNQDSVKGILKDRLTGRGGSLIKFTHKRLTPNTEAAPSKHPPDKKSKKHGKEKTFIGKIRSGILGVFKTNKGENLKKNGSLRAGKTKKVREKKLGGGKGSRGKEIWEKKTPKKVLF